MRKSQITTLLDLLCAGFLFLIENGVLHLAHLLHDFLVKVHLLLELDLEGPNPFFKLTFLFDQDLFAFLTRVFLLLEELHHTLPRVHSSLLVPAILGLLDR